MTQLYFGIGRTLYAGSSIRDTGQARAISAVMIGQFGGKKPARRRLVCIKSDIAAMANRRAPVGLAPLWRALGVPAHAHHIDHVGHGA
ncbi:MULTISPECIES: hypothetical protein [unclassified Rhizobium]|uniref:hypothetical protein n=1 Tax=unclassified Rhizobium TaxID=2613769 RepID=UPI0013C4DE94|nr:MULTISPECIES: hypothetical protein [unclassified Rhizobium]